MIVDWLISFLEVVGFLVVGRAMNLCWPDKEGILPFWHWAKPLLALYPFVIPIFFLWRGSSFADNYFRQALVAVLFLIIACIKTRKKPPKKRKAKKEKTSLSRPALNGSFVPVGA
jgi:hypothetical protein